MAASNFWNWFVTHQSELEAFIMTENRDYAIYNELTEELQKFSELLFPEITINQSNNKYVLIITPDGILEGIGPTREIVAAAPEFNNWEIVRFRQPNDQVNLNYDGLSYASSDIKVRYELDEDTGKAHIQLFIRKMNIDDKKYQALAFLYMDHILGEFNSITKVGYIDFVNLPEGASINDTISLLELRKLIEDKLY